MPLLSMAALLFLLKFPELERSVLHLFHHSKCWIRGLERAVVLQTGKRAGAEAPFDVYVCTSLVDTGLCTPCGGVEVTGTNGSRVTWITDLHTHRDQRPFHKLRHIVSL